ncbi:MAG: insulinase family protein [Planctomycetaceae bacterium]|nr:insulinase family protein [Planctomycetaceae bacterium]
MKFHSTVLDNGLTVIAETNPHVHSVGLGFFVKTGARDESPEVAGVSHFLEHMAFKGFDNLTADDVNQRFDDVGASYNASTSEEVTQYYAAILPEYLPQTFELLAGIIQPSLKVEDFNTEKQVILEEIGMYDDLPGFTVYEQAMAAHFRGHPLGQSILGSPESITALTADQMRDYHADRYRAGNIILAVAGNTSWEQIQGLVERYCAKWPGGGGDRNVYPASPEPTQHFQPLTSIQQEHVMIMIPAPEADSPDRYAADILAMIIGDDTNSRMFWDIIDPGHADSADFGYAEYDGSGAYLSYLAGEPEETPANLERLKTILTQVSDEGITDEELEQAKNKVSSRVVLASERPMGRLASLGGNWIYREEYRAVKTDLDTIQSITKDDLHALVEKWPLELTTVYGLGPLEGV